MHLSQRRRTATRLVGILALAAAALAGTLATAPGQAAVDPVTPGPPTGRQLDPRPNIVVIVTDDQRRDTLRFMPAVQRLLVQQGTRYTNAMVPTSLCCPSRATILTGRYAHTTGVFGNGDVGGERWGGWSRFYATGAERRTVAVALQRAGYRTGLVGKYLNYFGRSESLLGPGYTPPGWDYFSALLSTHGAYYDYRLSDGGSYGRAPEDYSTDVFAARAVDFVTTAPASQPLFLYFAPYAPHKPYAPAPRHLGSLDGLLPTYTSPTLQQRSRTLPRWMRPRARATQADVDVIRQRQVESLLAVDEAVASIHQALQQLGRDRNTLYVFTSDNGYFWGDHRIIGKDGPYQDSTRVPMVVRWDGRVPAGVSSKRLVLNVDLAATIARAAGVSMRTDGLDMLGDRRRRGFLLEAMYGYNNRPAYCGWRTRNRMYVQWATGEEELYDYRLDPAEQRNLAGRPDWQKVRKAMRAQARDACVPKPPGMRW